MQVTQATPAGWYPDPENAGQQRYWDGTAWTQNFAPLSAPEVPTPVAAKKPIYKRTWFIVVAVIIALGVIGNLFGGSPSTTTDSTPTTTKSSQPPADVEAEPEAAAPDVAEPEPEAEPVEEPTEPEMSMGQEQAVQSAQTYLSMGGFSRKKLIDQLVFEEFSKADAEFAVDYISPDWNAQAAQSAQTYVDMGGFSRQKLIDQLLFEGFSQTEAEYGVKAAGY